MDLRRGRPLSRRVFLAGATGSIGRATADALLQAGHEVVCAVRGDGRRGLPDGVEVRAGDPSDPDSLRRDLFRGERFDAVISCMASRTGAPAEAWAIDHRAHLELLDSAVAAGADQFVLLSAICVQKPRLEFQRAKLAFESVLRQSSLDWSIVRPTAFFKSISGQIDRVRAGRPYLIFGDGRGTACKPIADADVAEYLVGCLDDPTRRNRVLPIGGPGPALTPRDQGELLFEVAGIEPSFRSVPLWFMGTVVRGLAGLARLVPPLRDKAELARIGYYYATESMLVWDEAEGRYDAEATPEFGTRTLRDYYRARLSGEIADQRGEHAVL